MATRCGRAIWLRNPACGFSLNPSPSSFLSTPPIQTASRPAAGTPLIAFSHAVPLER
jgi:hypothetical protein